MNRKEFILNYLVGLDLPAIMCDELRYAKTTPHLCKANARLAGAIQLLIMDVGCLGVNPVLIAQEVIDSMFPEFSLR